MRSNRLHRAAVLGGVTLTLALAMSACSASNENGANSNPGSGGSSTSQLSGTLNGAGSTAQESAMAAWKAGFQGSNSSVTVNYDAIGSGGGVDQFLSGAVQFAGSDAYLSDAQLKQAKSVCHGSAIEVPTYVSPIAVIYNLPGVKNLKLTPDTVGKIFAGKITTWNDPAITASNPGVKLPSTSITPVHRSDDSGTTNNFTDYLHQAAGGSWTYPASETWPLKSGESADGTSGVVSAVQNGQGTIGYADASQAGTLGKALIQVGSQYVGPTSGAAAKVLDESKPLAGRSSTDLAIVVNRTPSGKGIYPIVLVSYQITCSHYGSQSTVNLVKGFEKYVISAGGQSAAAKQAGSAPITTAIRTKAEAAIESISMQ
ncbi:MAG: phosphate ABC transporter substrate-binding protein PstS [Nocardioidaceae bacterium]